MVMTERYAGDVTILEVEGKILIGEGDIQLKRKIDELVECKHTKLLLNLANVSYIDSGGLGEIVRAFVTLYRAGGELKVIYFSDLSDLLTVTKLLVVFDEDLRDEARAIKSFD